MKKEYIRSFFHTPTQEEIDSAIYITWAGHRVCNPKHSIGPRVLENYKIILTVKGSGYFEQEGKKYEIKEGDIFVLFPGVKHFYYANPEDPWELMWVSFNGKICVQIMDSLYIKPDMAVVKDSVSPVIKWTLMDIIDNLENGEREGILRANGYLYILFAELLSAIKKDDGHSLRDDFKKDIIKKAKMFINLNYYNPINVDLVCRHVNYSRSYFSRIFKKETGLSVPEYVNKVRIEKAKYLLQDTNLSVKEVAKSVGIEDALYFSRMFKEAVGISPLYYKKAVENGLSVPLDKITML